MALSIRVMIGFLVSAKPGTSGLGAIYVLAAFVTIRCCLSHKIEELCLDMALVVFPICGTSVISRLPHALALVTYFIFCHCWYFYRLLYASTSSFRYRSRVSKGLFDLAFWSLPINFSYMLTVLAVAVKSF